jgi:hypothetical protein
VWHTSRPGEQKNRIVCHSIAGSFAIVRLCGTVRLFHTKMGAEEANFQGFIPFVAFVANPT